MTRKGFAAFWCRAMSPTERAVLVEHLKGCEQCDHSFRVFALSAPVLHSESQPVSAATRPPLNLVRARGFASVRPESRARLKVRSWRPVAAAAALLIIGGLSAWSSTRYPVENFTESIAADSADIDGAIYSSETPASPFDAVGGEAAPSDLIESDPTLPGNSGHAG